MKPKHTIQFTPSGIWLDEYLEDEIYDALRSMGGNRSSKQLIFARKFSTIEELVEEYISACHPPEAP